MADVWWYENRGCWCADVPDPAKPGKRKRLYLGKEKGKARQKLHEYLARYYSVNNSPRRSDLSEDSPLVKLVAQFSRWAETNMAQTTLERYIYALKPFLESHGHMPGSELRPLDVEQHKAELKESGASPRTVNYFVQAIKRVLNWAVQQEILERNPVAHVKRVPKKPHEDKSLGDKAVEAFLEKARESQPLGDFCEVLLLTGMRVSELLNLKWEHIDLDRRIARVFEHKTASRATGRPKTVPLSGRAVELLEQQPKVSEFIFTGRDGQALSYSGLKSRKARLEKKYTDMPRVTFHAFRHTCATRLARAGVPERVAQEILGHSSTMMTRYYTTTSREELLDAVEKIDK